MNPRSRHGDDARTGNRTRFSYATGVLLGSVVCGLTVLLLDSLVDPTRTWLRDVAPSWAPHVVSWTAPANASPDPTAASDATIPVVSVEHAVAAASFGPSVGPRVMQWSQSLDPAIRKRLTIALPDDVRSLFPHAGDSLVVAPETVWLARCIYSESNRPREQELVAWVVRNRVVVGYRGRFTIRDVVLDPYQFSAFNSGHPRRAYYLSLLPEHTRASWQRALRIAAYVRRAPWSKRPFSVRVRHFYSEISMEGPSPPRWARDEIPIDPDRPYPIDPVRFRFFALDEPLNLNWPSGINPDAVALHLADASGSAKSRSQNGLAGKAISAYPPNESMR